MTLELVASVESSVQSRCYNKHCSNSPFLAHENFKHLREIVSFHYLQGTEGRENIEALKEHCSSLTLQVRKILLCQHVMCPKMSVHSYVSDCRTASCSDISKGIKGQLVNYDVSSICGRFFFSHGGES